MISRFNDQNWFPSLFNDFFGDDYWMTANRKNNVTAPAVNVIDEDKQYRVEVAAPGMTKQDFQVKVDNDNNLVIALEKRSDTAGDKEAGDKEAGDKEAGDKEAANKKNHKYLRREFSYSKYQQAFTLPDNVDKAKIAAHMTDGILTIEIPKVESAPVVDTSRQIEIK
jgi:HSP20 family protein